MNWRVITQRLYVSIALSGVLGIGMIMEFLVAIAQSPTTDTTLENSTATPADPAIPSTAAAQVYTIEQLEAQLLYERAELSRFAALVEAGALPRIELAKQRSRVIEMETALATAASQGLTEITMERYVLRTGKPTPTATAAPNASREDLQQQLNIQQSIVDNLEYLAAEGAIPQVTLRNAQMELNELQTQLETLENE